MTHGGSNGCERLGRNARLGPAGDGPRCSSTLKLRNDETEESVMMFEEVLAIRHANTFIRR